MLASLPIRGGEISSLDVFFFRPEKSVAKTLLVLGFRLTEGTSSDIRASRDWRGCRKGWEVETVEERRLSLREPSTTGLATIRGLSSIVMLVLRLSSCGVGMMVAGEGTNRAGHSSACVRVGEGKRMERG